MEIQDWSLPDFAIKLFINDCQEIEREVLKRKISTRHETGIPWQGHTLHFHLYSDQREYAVRGSWVTFMYEPQLTPHLCESTIFSSSSTTTSVSYQNLTELNEIKRLLLILYGKTFAQFNGVLPTLSIQEATWFNKTTFNKAFKIDPRRERLYQQSPISTSGYPLNPSGFSSRPCSDPYN